MGIPDASRRSDGELVRRALGGSESAFAELVRRYQDLLYRHAERMIGRPDDAEDAVQAAFIKAHRRLKSCRDPDRFGAWLFRIGSNACKDYLKSRRRLTVSLDDAPAVLAQRGNPDHSLDRRNMREAIDGALERLPVEQREAFLLKHVEGLSYVEISEMLDVSVPALKMRVHRARDELKVLLRMYDR